MKTVGSRWIQVCDCTLYLCTLRYAILYMTCSRQGTGSVVALLALSGASLRPKALWP
jgi:hypothetical protein